MKYIILLLLMVSSVVASIYTVDTIPNCDGFIKVRNSDDFKMIDCKLKGDYYYCPCALNKELKFESIVNKDIPIVYEYYYKNYNNPQSRITERKLINYEKDFYKRNDIPKTKVFLTVLLIFSIIIGLVITGVVLTYKWIDKVKKEDI